MEAVVDASGLPERAEPTPPAISVVVPARDVAASVIGLLGSLGPQLRAVGAELVFVDDASTDGTGAVVVEWSRRNRDVACTVVRAESRRGINGSRNVGVACSRGAFVAFCDGDDEVEPGWLANLSARRGPGVIVTGQVRDVRSGLVDAPGGFFGSGLASVFGGCFGVERDLLDAVGGFDEEIRRGGTESEFVLTAQLDHGATVVLAEDAVIRYHLPLERAALRRRSFARQKGHACVARRLATRREGITTSFTVRRRLDMAARHLWRMFTGRHGPRRANVDAFLTACVAVVWLVRYSLCLPPPRRADPAALSNYTVLVAPPEAGSVVSKMRHDPSP